MKKLVGILVALAVGYILFYETFWVWVVENVDVPSNKMLVLVAKTGKEMPPGHDLPPPLIPHLMRAFPVFQPWWTGEGA